jgi:DNA invertase Pin-like site-specific DNA recombinase
MNYIAYYRVSTDKQGASGLGLDAQRAAVQAYAADIIHSFTEIESGKNDHRPQLQAALAMCRQTGAALLIAKIDRLSRQAAFLLTLRDSGVQIVAADMPNAGTLEFGVRAVVAQHEREEISKRTKAALQAAKARGTKLGSPTIDKALKASIEAKKAAAAAFDAQVLPFIRKFQQAGHKTSRAIADQLTLAGVSTYRGGNRWGHAQVCEILRRAA